MTNDDADDTDDDDEEAFEIVEEDEDRYYDHHTTDVFKDMTRYSSVSDIMWTHTISATSDTFCMIIIRIHSSW